VKKENIRTTITTVTHVMQIRIILILYVLDVLGIRTRVHLYVKNVWQTQAQIDRPASVNVKLDTSTTQDNAAPARTAVVLTATPMTQTSRKELTAPHVSTPYIHQQPNHTSVSVIVVTTPPPAIPTELVFRSKIAQICNSSAKLLVNVRLVVLFVAAVMTQMILSVSPVSIMPLWLTPPKQLQLEVLAHAILVIFTLILPIDATCFELALMANTLTVRTSVLLARECVKLAMETLEAVPHVIQVSPLILQILPPPLQTQVTVSALLDCTETITSLVSYVT